MITGTLDRWHATWMFHNSEYNHKWIKKERHSLMNKKTLAWGFAIVYKE